jgi:hypothetical protein
VYQEDEARKIDLRKQADGIVAHLVHSLDAAHMMLTINRLQTSGVRHFAMVHDGFGVRERYRLPQSRSPGGIRSHLFQTGIANLS